MTESFHLDILPSQQRRLLDNLGPVVTNDGFYLAGGTAVALYLGHRRSIDLDWFTSDTFPEPMQYAEVLRQEGIPFEVRDTARGTLHGNSNGVKVSFLRYTYRLLDELQSTPELPCEIASLRDLACMKLSAVASRGTKKDFVDIWALGEHGFSLPEMVSWYQEKYQTDDVSHILAALSYFDDVKPEPMPEMVWSGDWPDIKETIQQRVKQFAE